MAKTQTSNSSLLNILYDHLEIDEWDDGIDLYQAGKVKQLKHYERLLSAKVDNLGPRAFDVRLKFHPNDKVIQWFECSCSKNRKNGAICEHLIALIVHIDREKPKLFQNLDKKLPITLPKIRKKRNIEQDRIHDETKHPGEGHEWSKNALMALVERGNIHSAKMKKDNGKIILNFEVKEGIVDAHELDVDVSSYFLGVKKNKSLFKGKMAQLEIMPHLAFPSLIFRQVNDHIICEKSVAVLAPDHVHENILERAKIPVRSEILNKLSREEVFTSLYLTLPFKKIENNFGKDSLFIPGIGYFKYDTSNISGEWYDLPYSKKLNYDEAGELIDNEFADFLDTAVVLVTPELKPNTVIKPTLSKIKVEKINAGWFFLDPQYGEGSHQISMLELIEHVKKRKKYIEKNGSWLKIPTEISNYDWTIDEKEKLVKLDAIGLIRFRASIGDFDNASGSKDVLKELRRSTSYKKSEQPPVLDHTNLKLRQYQKEGFSWLWWLYSNNLHGLLADDMGLGKTHQAMALMSAIQKDRLAAQTKIKNLPKHLVICPTTVLDHWEEKIIEFAPNLKPLKYHGPKRKFAIEYIHKKFHTIITSYGVVLRDIGSLSQIKWETVILDEAHLIKNNSTATYKAVCKLDSKMRLCLTGTPIENELKELKTLYDFMIPGYLGSDKYFKNQFSNLNNTSKDDEESKSVELRKLINPLKMRRTKDQVLKDLPEKIEDLRHCTLSDEQVAIYREIVSLKSTKIIEQLSTTDSPIPYMHVFATLQMLKQICNHPSLLTGKNWKLSTSGKFELLKNLLTEAFRSGHKVVIFSQYVRMIQIISEYLASIEISHTVLNGATRNRGKVIEKFQTDPNCKVFIGSLLAGGVGIDLTAASVVIHYDRWWNPSKENQATDRVHRIGQKRAVQVIKLVTKGTLEEKIDEMITKKKRIFEKFMEKDEELFKKLSKEELIELLSG